jgi:hypothetical protein
MPKKVSNIIFSKIFNKKHPELPKCSKLINQLVVNSKFYSVNQVETKVNGEENAYMPFKQKKLLR